MAISNQNEAQIVARIEELRGDLASNFAQICELLTLVKGHYLHCDPHFCWYREVASGKLIPELVIAMARNRNYLKHMMGRPRDVQMQIARDCDLSWCCESKGEVVERRTSWRKMRAVDFKRMFPIGAAVRTSAEQRALLEKDMAAEPRAFVRGQPLARVEQDSRTFFSAVRGCL